MLFGLTDLRLFLHVAEEGRGMESSPACRSSTAVTAASGRRRRAGRCCTTRGW